MSTTPLTNNKHHANDSRNSCSDDSHTGNPKQSRLDYRLRRWHVTFGNPALGTYGGSIVTRHPRSRRRRRLLLVDDDGGDGDDGEEDADSHTTEEDESEDNGNDDDSSESSGDSFSSCSSLESLLQSDEPLNETTTSSNATLSVAETTTTTTTKTKTKTTKASARLSTTESASPTTPTTKLIIKKPPNNNKAQSSSLKRMRRIAVMANVPPDQVPDGVLNLVRGHRPFIEHVRVVIGSSRAEEAEQRRQRWKRRRAEMERRSNHHHRCIISLNNGGLRSNDKGVRRRSHTWACENDERDNRCAVKSVVESLSSASIGNSESRNGADSDNNGIANRDARSSSVDGLTFFSAQQEVGHNDGRDYDTTGGTCAIENNEHQAAAADEEDKNYHLLFVLDSEDSTDTFVGDLNGRPYTTLDESETCSVHHAVYVEGENGVSLLGPFFASSSSPSASSPKNQPSSPSAGEGSPSTAGNHHAMDEHQCPVCLEKMCLPSPSSSTSTAANASSSILTTVCNHSFHIDCLLRWQDSPCPVCRYDHSGLNHTLSRCHACASTVRNYVCLICGVISCVSGPSSSSLTPLATGEGGDHAPSAQVPSQRGHALQHYEETLHAYALDTESQHVWDFAGGGYVHRLLQNTEDGKIVEGRDPRALMEVEQGLYPADGGTSPLSAMERSNIPTYSSSAEDDEAVHRKLEGIAGQYYTLLKSQLEQQRIYYEGRLEAIRREHEHDNGAYQEEKSTSDLISALKQERNQLEQRCVTLRRKHKKVSDDAMFLKNMNESLEADKVHFRKQIAEAQVELAKAREMTVQSLAPLEEKVFTLMIQLESDEIGNDLLEPNKKPSARKK